MVQVPQSQQHSDTTRSHLVQKPPQPVKGFLIKATPMSPARETVAASEQSAQVSLTPCFEQAKQELQRLSKQARAQVPHTPAEQMVFAHSAIDLLEQLEALYAQATGRQPLQAKSELQGRYAQVVALLSLFYGQAQQSPEALARMKRLFYQIYVQAQKRQPAAVSLLEASRRKSHVVQPQAPRSSVSQAQGSPVPPASPAPVTSVQAAPLLPDESSGRSWSPAELQQLQQARQRQTQTPPPIKVRSPLPPAQPHPMQEPPPSMQPGSAADQRSFVPLQTNAPDLGSIRAGTHSPAASRLPRDRQSWDPRVSRREYLLRERTSLEREVQRVLGSANALNQRWQFWSTQKVRLEQDRRLIPAKEALSLLAHRLVRLPLPSAARNIAYRESRLRQEEAWLHQQTIAVNARYAALLEEINVIDTEMDLLQL